MLMERSYRQDLSTSPAYPGYRKLHSSHIPPESRQIMRIVCPSCAARYEIADTMLAKPRTVRCSRCAREWVQDPAPPIDIEQPARDAGTVRGLSEPPVEPIQWEDPKPAAASSPEMVVAEAPYAVTEAAPRDDKRQRARVTLAWIGSLLLLAALAVGAYANRAQIQTAWPPSERLFRLLPSPPGG